jgi:hypothetical protein
LLEQSPEIPRYFNSVEKSVRCGVLFLFCSQRSPT